MINCPGDINYSLDPYCGRNDLFVRVIREMEALPFTHPVSVNIDAAQFLYALAKFLQPQLILEIGCFIGFSTLHLAQALKENGRGKVLAVDLFSLDMSAENLAIVTEKKVINQLEIAELFKSKARLEEYVTFVKGPSGEIRPRIEKEVRTSIDLLFIDGDHTVPGVFADINTYYDDVKVGGYILLHDIYPQACGWDGPWLLLRQLKKGRYVPRCLDMVEFPTTDGYGFALLRKRTPETFCVTPPFAYRLPHLIRKKIGAFPGKVNSESFFRSFYRIYYELFPRYFPSNQTVAVELLVKDEETGKPLSGVTVRCDKVGLETLTDADGSIRFDRVWPDEYALHVSADGYLARENVRVTISNNIFNPKKKIVISLKKADGAER